MGPRETDYYAMFDGELATRLFRVRWVDNPNVTNYPGPFPRFEQLDHERRWVQNKRLIGTIGGHGGSDADVWKISAEDAEKVAKRLGVELLAPTAGCIHETKEDEDAR